MTTQQFDYFEAFSRNIGLITRKEQKILRNARVAIAGLGGVGGIHLATLARQGIGKFNISDLDSFNQVNFNRQYGANIDTLGESKSEVMKKIALAINPECEIRCFPDGICIDNINEFLEGVDIYVDGLDFFEIDVRRLLFRAAQEKGIYCVTAGPIGFSSALLVFSPEGMSFDDYFGFQDNMEEWDKIASFAVGLAPRATQFKYMSLDNVSFQEKYGPSASLSCQLCSGMAAAETLKILLGRGLVKVVPHYFQFDSYRLIYKKGYMPWGNKNPIQRLKRWWLAKKFADIMRPKV
jgi:molybdopterin/thiamine biosynthesis adenylyltransferase